MGKRWVVLLGSAVVILALIGWGVYHWAFRDADGDDGPTIPPTVFSELKRTVVVPTLDTPIPEGKSAVWCASFQLAWNRLKADVVKEPVRIKNAEAVADRLNKAPLAEDDLPSEGYYAAAGLARDGIRERIQREMRERFPDAPAPELSDDPDVTAVTYAYLRAAVPFRAAYRPIEEGVNFSGSDGRREDVRAFGLRRPSPPSLTRHVEVLAIPVGESARDMKWFAVDLCKESSPNQLVLAVVPRRESLAAILADLDGKLRAFDGKPQGAERSWRKTLSEFTKLDELHVPEMHWRVEHRFRELEGPDKTLLHSGLGGVFLGTARQQVDFTLNRRGARVASQGRVDIPKADPRDFHFDRPFLVVMKRRGAERPFFVLWVDNAELLRKRE